MNTEPMSFTAKNGQTIVLRSAREDDGEKLRQLAWQAYGETRFLSKEQEEFTLTSEQESDWIMRMSRDPKALLLMAYMGDELIGNAMIHPVAVSGRQKHRCQAGITVLKDHWGQGIGKALMVLLVTAAKEADYEQMELEVVAENERAIGLYETIGFKAYGCRPNSFRYKDGSYADMLLMALDLR